VGSVCLISPVRHFRCKEDIQFKSAQTQIGITCSVVGAVRRPHMRACILQLRDLVVRCALRAEDDTGVVALHDAQSCQKRRHKTTSCPLRFWPHEDIEQL